MSQLEIAIKEYINRRDRITHPDGTFDGGGRWYPSEDEECDCCQTIREPSRSYPYSLMVHCRTMKHVANIYNVSISDMKKELQNV